MIEKTLDDIMVEMAEEDRQAFIDELSQTESFDEKDIWESGEVCRDCFAPLPDPKGEYTCRCGATYTTEGYKGSL